MHKTLAIGLNLKTLALAIGLASASLAQAGTIVAPYFYTWGFGNSAYKVKTLMEGKQQAGMDGATLAFAVSGGGCTLGGGMEQTLDNPTFSTDIRQFVAGGGKLILSFGGAAGTYLESVCSADALTALARKLIDAHGVRALDFDIEGAQLEDQRLNSVRNTAIKQLQAIYPDLYVSFTLPVAPYLNANDTGGLPASAVNLVRGAAQAGVKISVVNLMTMDYGPYYSSGRKMGDLAISAAQQTFGQLKGVYPAKTDAQLWAMIGITPMIGKNDVASEVFTPADALAVTNFAKQKGVGLLAMWAMQRDRVGSGDLAGYSGVNTRDHEFYQTFAAAKSDTPVPPTASRHQIKSLYSGLCLDIEGGSAADGAKLQQSVCSNAASQRFDLTKEASGAYRIANVQSGKSLDVSSASTANGALLQQWSANAGDNQRFVLGAEGSSYTIRARHSGKCVDVKDWSQVAGARIQQWTCGSGNNQRWNLIDPITTPVPPTPPGPGPGPVPNCQAWSEGKTYNAGVVVSYQGKNYKALVTHTAWTGTGWNPAATPTLWAATGAASCG